MSVEMQQESRSTLPVFAGVLALVFAGGGALFWLAVYFGFSGYHFFYVAAEDGPMFLDFVALVLAAGAGILILRGSARVAPWLMLGALMMHVVFIISMGVSFESWFPFVGLFRVLIHANTLIGVNGLFALLFNLAYAALFVGTILAFIAMVKAPTVATPARAASTYDPYRTWVNSTPVDVPEGWYRDPDGKPCQRFWDGQNWGERTRPLV